MRNYDFIVIGFGKAGKTFASYAAKQGKNVALVEENEKMYGGTCINIGCIPSKKLEYQSRQKEFTGAEGYRKAVENKNNLIGKLREKNYKMVEGAGVDIYKGKGSFVDKNTVRVEGSLGDVKEIRGSNIIINTGAETVVPKIQGLDTVNYYLSTTMMEKEDLPKELIIVGGGYIGLEFASIYADFGSKVTVIEGNNRILPREDDDVAERVAKLMEEQGVEFSLDSKVERVEQSGDRVRVFLSKGGTQVEIAGDTLLLATGRRPNVSSLNLENAGVKLNEMGAILVDEGLKTSADNIFAVGDVKGGLQFTYISLDDFRILKDRFFGNGERSQNNRAVVPYSLFVNPNFARVGLNEKEARANYPNVKTSIIECAGVPRNKIVGRDGGLLKAIVDGDSKKILGATFVCPESSEMINIVALAMNGNLDYTFLRDMIFTHPTMSESLNDLFNI